MKLHFATDLPAFQLSLKSSDRDKFLQRISGLGGLQCDVGMHSDPFPGFSLILPEA